MNYYVNFNLSVLTTSLFDKKMIWFRFNNVHISVIYTHFKNYDLTTIMSK